MQILSHVSLASLIVVAVFLGARSRRVVPPPSSGRRVLPWFTYPSGRATAMSPQPSRSDLSQVTVDSHDDDETLPSGSKKIAFPKVPASWGGPASECASNASATTATGPLSDEVPAGQASPLYDGKEDDECESQAT